MFKKNHRKSNTPVHRIVNTFDLIFVGFMHVILFLCLMKQTDRNILNKNKNRRFNRYSVSRSNSKNWKITNNPK